MTETTHSLGAQPCPFCGRRAAAEADLAQARDRADTLERALRAQRDLWGAVAAGGVLTPEAVATNLGYVGVVLAGGVPAPWRGTER